MIIKKFQGKTKEEALASARRELGDNIVEMNVKAVKPKGLKGIFKGTRFEVTVAREDENEKYSAVASTEIQKDGVAVSIGQSCRGCKSCWSGGCGCTFLFFAAKARYGER